MSLSLGPISVEFAGTHPVRARVETELQLASQHETEQRLVISIDSERPPIEGATLDGSRLMLKHSVVRHTSGLRFTTGLKHAPPFYSVDIGTDLLAEDVAHAYIYLPHRLETWSRLSSPVARLLSRDTATLLEVAAKNTIYELVDGLAQYRLLRAGASFLHASAVAGPAGTVVVAGMGGVGKSTSLLAAMARYPELAYVGDDLVVVQSDNLVSRHPKRIQIYRYNLEQDAALQTRLLSQLSLWRRAVWLARARLLGPKQARFRVPADELFGEERVNDKGRLVGIVWAAPSDADTVTVTPMDDETIARRCAVALTDELWDFVRLMSLGSVLSPAGMPIGEFVDKILAVYTTAFANVPAFEMLVPRRSDPNLLAHEIATVAGLAV